MSRACDIQPFSDYFLPFKYHPAIEQLKVIQQLKIPNIEILTSFGRVSFCAKYFPLSTYILYFEIQILFIGIEIIFEDGILC